MKEVIVLISGGIDSFVMTYLLMRRNFCIYPLFVDYGHLSAKEELAATERICEFLNIQSPLVVKINGLSNLVSCGLTKGSIESDFFPSRNILLLTVASSIAQSRGIHAIALGIIGSGRSFPDSTLEFARAAERFLSTFSNFKIIIFTPLSSVSKVDIVSFAKREGLPLEITYSCQKGGEEHCGVCPSCRERFESLTASLG